MAVAFDAVSNAAGAAQTNATLGLTFAHTCGASATLLIVEAAFSDADGGVQFPNTTGEWPDSPTHWALLDGDTMWDCAPLIDPLDVTAAGTGPSVVVTIFYDDNVLSPI